MPHDTAATTPLVHAAVRAHGECRSGRDRRTEGVTDRVLARIGAAEIYRATGTPLLPINTATQLVAMEGSPLLDEAERLALLPDLFGYWLTGEHATDQTIASTSQMLDAASDHFGRAGLERAQVVRIDVPGRGAGEEGEGTLRA